MDVITLFHTHSPNDVLMVVRVSRDRSGYVEP